MRLPYRRRKGFSCPNQVPMHRRYVRFRPVQELPGAKRVRILQMSPFDVAKDRITNLLSRPQFGYVAAGVFVFLSASRDVEISEEYPEVPVSLMLLTAFLVPVLLACAFHLIPTPTKDTYVSPYDEQNLRATVVLNISTLIGWFATLASLNALPAEIVAAIATGLLPLCTTVCDVSSRSRHRLAITDLLGSLIVLTGVSLLILVGNQYDPIDWRALALAFVIPVAGAVSNVKVRQLNEMGVSTRSVYSSRFWVLILVAFVAGAFEDLHVLTPTTASSLILLGLIGFSVPLYFIQIAVQRLGAQRAASMTGLTAVAALFLSESAPDPAAVHLWLGALLVPAGIYLGAAIPSAAIVDAFSSGVLLAPELTRRGFRCIHIQSKNNLDPYLTAQHQKEHFSHHMAAEGANPFDMLAMLKKKGVQIVIAGSESGVELADKLSESLDLPTNGSGLSAARRDKFKMINLLRQRGLMVAEHCKTADIHRARKWARARFEKRECVIVKPLRSAAADKVHLCSTVAEVNTAFRVVLGGRNLFGCTNMEVLLEQYLTGEEYVVNTVSHDGDHFVTDIWRKSVRRLHGTSLVNDYDELLPSQGPLQDALNTYVRRTLDALEIKYGPAHAELKMTPDGPALIEIAARLVGARLPEICHKCTGTDPVSLVVDAYVNRKEFRRKTRFGYQLGSHGRVVFLISGSAGEWAHTAKNALLCKFHKVLSSFAGAELTPSDRTKPTLDLLSCPGVVFLAASTDEELVRDYDAIRAMEAESVYGVDHDDAGGFGEFDREERGRHFSHAVAECPAARENEILKMLQLVAAEPGERLVDFGAGNGLLTKRIAFAVEGCGRVVAIDSSMAAMKSLQDNLGSVAHVERRLWRHDSIPLATGSVDGIVSLANLHHVEYKNKLFREFCRVLTPSGRLVIGDVAANTMVQQYFDGPVDKFCSTGHKHPFLDEQATRKLCDQAGLEMVSWSIADVPWRFSSVREMMMFIHGIHDAQCSPEECLKHAKDYLGYEETPGKVLLKWQLFFMVARRTE